MGRDKWYSCDAHPGDTRQTHFWNGLLHRIRGTALCSDRQFHASSFRHSCFLRSVLQDGIPEQPGSGFWARLGPFLVFYQKLTNGDKSISSRRPAILFVSYTSRLQDFSSILILTKSVTFAFNILSGAFAFNPSVPPMQRVLLSVPSVVLSE